MEDVPSNANLHDNLMPSSASQRQQTVEGSVVGGESVGHHHDHVAGENLEQNADGSRISSETSVTTGPVGHSAYPQSESAVSAA